MQNVSSKAKPYVPIPEAALRLGITPEALRARCRRAMRRDAGVTRADLGGGISAVLFGSTWRVIFPDPLQIAVALSRRTR